MSAVPKILIVDDEPRMRDSLSIILRSVGYETRLSASGEEALGVFSENEFDVVLLDVILPGMNGYEVLSHMRKRRPETFVLMMTGRTSVQSAVRAIKEGAFDYLSKPIDHEELLIRIGNAISQKRLLMEKSKLETVLNEVQRLELINVLAGGLAHDFNNVLTVLQGIVSLMLMETGPGHALYPRLQDMEGQIEVGARLTRKLLGHIRKEQGAVEPIDVNRHVRETVDVFRRSRKGVNVKQELQEGLPATSMARGQIEQVLLNLLINAADAMPGGGDIIVATSVTQRGGIQPGESAPRYLTITVSDTGEGMDAEILRHVFEPFFTTKPAGKGTGLGLTSVYSIVRGAGGYVEVQSVKGAGTVFEVHLPITHGSLPPAGRGDASPGAHGMVLLVDDDEVILRTGHRLLESLGYKALAARDGETAIRIFREYGSEVGIILLDLMMPGMTGDEVFEALREIDPAVNVAIVSGYADESVVEALLRRGVRGFLRKPYGVGELSRFLREHMRPAPHVGH